MAAFVERSKKCVAESKATGKATTSNSMLSCLTRLTGGEPDAQIALMHLVTLTLHFLHPVIYSRESEVVLLT